MAETTVDALIVEIRADFDDFKKDILKAQGVASRSSKQMSKSFSQMGQALRAVGRRLAGVGVAVATAGAAFVSFRAVVDGLNAVDGLAKTADRLGLTTEALGGLRFAANQTGVEASLLENSLQRMNRRVAEAAIGGGPAANAIKELGLSAQDLVRQSPDQAFGTIADRLLTVKSTADKTRLAFAFFDTEGGKLLNTIANGSKGLEKYRKEAEALGITISRFDAAQVEAANDALDKVGKTFQAIGQRIAIGVAPLLQFFSDQIVAAAKNTGGLGDVFNSFAKGAVQVVGFVIDAVNGLRIAWQAVKAAIAGGQIIIGSLVKLSIKGFASMDEAFVVLGKTMGVTWAGIENLWTAGLTRVRKELAILLRAAGDRANIFGTTDTGKALIKASDDLIESGVEASSNARLALSRAKAELDKSVGDLDKAFSGAKTPFIDDFIKASQGQGAEAEKAINDILSATPEGGFAESLVTEFEEYKAIFNAQTLEKLELMKEAASQEIDVEKSKEDQLALQRQEFLKSQRDAEIKVANENRALWESGAKGRLQIMGGLFNSLSVLMNTESRKQFEIGKAAAIAGATIDTYRAATSAYASLAGIPIVGPALGAAAAAAAVAAGLANVSSIQSQQMGGGGGGSAGAAAPAAGGSAGVGAGGGEAPTEAGGGGSSTLFNVTLQGERFSGSQIRELLSGINDQLDDNATIRTQVG